MAEKHYVVVDGSNLATEGRTVPSLAQLGEAVRAYAREDPSAQIVVVVDASFGHRIDPSEAAQLEQAELLGELVSPPAGAIGRGDAFVLRIAERSHAAVLSNDSFQEFHGEHPWLFDDGRLIGGKPVRGIGWIFTPRLPVRGSKSRHSLDKAKSKSKGKHPELDIPPAEKAAELAKAAKKVARSRQPAGNGDGSVPRVGDVWVPPAPGESPAGVATPHPGAVAAGASRARKGRGLAVVEAAGPLANSAKATATKATAAKATAAKATADTAHVTEEPAANTESAKAGPHATKTGAAKASKASKASKKASKAAAAQVPAKASKAAARAGPPNGTAKKGPAKAAAKKGLAKAAAKTTKTVATKEAKQAVVPVEETAAKPAIGAGRAGRKQAAMETATKVTAAKRAAKKAAAAASAATPTPTTAPTRAALAPAPPGKVARRLRSAIVEATAEALEPPVAESPDGAGKGGGKKGKRRRRAGAPLPAVNEPLAFINFVAAYPLGSVVGGEVASFTSHGAMVEVPVPGGASLHCYIPLSALGDPPPARARDVLSRGERREFVLVDLDPPRRVAELSLVGVGAAVVGASAGRGRPG